MLQHGGGYDGFLYIGAAESCSSVVFFSFLVSFGYGSGRNETIHLTILFLPVASRLDSVLFGYEGIAYMALELAALKNKRAKTKSWKAFCYIICFTYTIFYFICIYDQPFSFSQQYLAKCDAPSSVRMSSTSCCITASVPPGITNWRPGILLQEFMGSRLPLIKSYSLCHLQGAGGFSFLSSPIHRFGHKSMSPSPSSSSVSDVGTCSNIAHR